MRLPRTLRTDLFDVESSTCRDPARVGAAYQVLSPLLRLWFRPEVRGLDRIPPGPCLFVANHNAGMLMPEMYLLCVSIYEREGCAGLPYGLAHSLGVRLPLLHGLLPPLGAVDGKPSLGSRLLNEGHRVLIFPGGELDSMRPSRHNDRVVFENRRGYIRLALRSGAPIVPVVTAGAHETLYILDDGRWLARLLGLDRRWKLKTWPVVLCAPWGLWLGVPPPHIPRRTKIIQELLAPVTFKRRGEDAANDEDYVEQCHRLVHGRMERTLRRLNQERRQENRR